jgi:hypothetical protein
MKNFSFTLLLLPAAATAQSEVRVCGSTFWDALFNCKTNPSCQTGEGCPKDTAMCFAFPENICQSPSLVAPTPALQVCGLNYEHAQSSCDRLCEEGCGTNEACFNVLPRDLAEDSMPENIAVSLLGGPSLTIASQGAHAKKKVTAGNEVTCNAKTSPCHSNDLLLESVLDIFMLSLVEPLVIL